MLVNPVVLAYAKYILNNYAFGYSPMKPTLLVLFLSILSLLSLFPSPWRSSWNPLVLVGALSLYAASLAEYLHYCSQYDLSITERSVMVYDGLQSSTRLEHMHNSKAVLAQILGYAGQGFDVGRPFLAHSSPLWLWIHGISYLLFCGLLVLFIHHYQKKLSPERAVLLGLGGYTLVKGLIDGGPFSIEDVSGFLLLTAVLLEGKARRWGLVFLTLLFTLCLGLELHKGFLYILGRILASVAALSVPLLCEQARHKASKVWLLGPIFGFGFLLLHPIADYRLQPLRRSPPYGLATIHYGHSVLKKDWNVTLVSRGSLVSGEFGEVVAQRRGNRLSVSTLKLARSTTPFELCEHYHLNILRSPVSWYPHPAYVLVEGAFEMESPERWLRSETVLATSFESKENWTKLVLKLVPGALTNVAVDILPKGPFATRRVNSSFREPEVTAPWKPGPGKP